MSRFAALAEEAEQHSPMSNGEVPQIEGRLLLADGDGLCYYCAGNEETAPGTARANMLDKIRSAARAAGASAIKILLTAQGSHKGFRRAVARVKPYQGQRDDHRPKNWAYLRELLEVGGAANLGPDLTVELTAVAEADDLFALYAKEHPDCVIYTQDKDMKMVPGWHLDWLTHLMVHVPPGTWHKPSTDLAKPYGRVFFWQQMLQGDSADNIPGLPFYTDGSIVKSGPNKGEIKQIRIGEPKKDQIGTAATLLDQIKTDMGACILLKDLYESCYGERWLVEMLEQGILLWMRSDAASDPFDVCQEGHPFHPLTDHELFKPACDEILARIKEFQTHEEAQNYGSCDGEGITAGEAAVQMCDLSATVPPTPRCAGSQPFNGTCASDLASGVQLPVGQGGEQLQEVRRVQPRGFPAWATRLLAAPHH